MRDPNRSGIPTVQLARDPDSGKPFVVKREAFKAQVFRPGWLQPTMTLAEFADKEVADAKERAERQAEAEKHYVRRAKQLKEAGLDQDDTTAGDKLLDAAAEKDREWDAWKDANPKGQGITKRF